MGRSVSSQRLAREWILFLFVYGEETRGFFLVSARLLASPVSSCCYAWSRRLQCRTQFASFFVHVVQSALGGPLVNSFRFSRFAAQTSVYAGQKNKNRWITGAEVHVFTTSLQFSFWK